MQCVVAGHIPGIQSRHGIGVYEREIFLSRNGRAETTLRDSRPISCRRCPLRKLPVFRTFSPRELDFMARFKTGELVVEAGATIVMEETASPHLFTVLDGWAYRHKQLEDGRRQVLNFSLAGDLVGLQSAMMNDIQHTVTALTRTTLCVFQRDRIWTMFTDFPELSYSLTWLAAREEQLLDGHLLSLGQRTALERAAFLFLHLYDRAERVGYAGEGQMRAPFTQVHLADALGITNVHFSRTLKKLQDRNLLRWSEGMIYLKDRSQLEAIAAYEPLSDQTRPLI